MGFFVNLILGALAIVLVVYGTIRSFKTKKYGVKNVIATNFAFLAIVGVIFWFVAPYFASLLLYRGLFLHFPEIISVIIGIVIIFASLIVFGSEKMGHKARLSLGIMYVVLGLLFIIGGPILINSVTDWQICKAYKFEQRPDLLESDHRALRFTPRHVAHNLMLNKISSSEFTVEYENNNPVDVNNGFGYVAPITPNGMYMMFSEKDDGFMVYDDTQGIPEDQRFKRVKQKFEIGEEMMWLDNIWRNLYMHDKTCVYNDIYYLQLNSENPDEFTGVAPKTEYEFEFPCFFIPYWAGVTLIHADGRIEDLSVEQALSDSRLQGKLIFPMELARKYVEVQIYNKGFIGGWINRPGKIEVPVLPGENQMPFYTVATDDHSYYIVSTEPAGESYAQYRVYYINAFTGERTYFERNINDGVLGPVAAIKYVKTLSGFVWMERDSKNGSRGLFQVIEPVYLTKDKNLYWKYTIATADFTGVAGTAVVNASNPDEVLFFKERPEFYDWLSGETTETVIEEGVDSTKTRIQNLENFLQKALEELNLLKKEQNTD